MSSQWGWVVVDVGYINIIQKGGKNEITGAKILTVIWKVEKEPKI
jgi:hypothetical protein